MELIFIAFIGTLLIMTVELCDFMQRTHTTSRTVPESPTVSDPLTHTVVDQAAESVYDAAA